MTLKPLLRHGLLLVLLMTIATSAYAVGFGIFASGGDVKAEWDGDLRSAESDGKHRDLGFTLDTNLETERLFNYRLELGRAWWKIDDFNDQGVAADLDGLVINNDFGFGGLVTPSMRLWFGPEIRITLIDGNLDENQARDVDLFGYGFGIAAGANFNTAGRLTFAAKTGYVMMRYLGEGPNYNNNGWWDSDYDLDEDLVYFGLSMFLRTKGD